MIKYEYHSNVLLRGKKHQKHSSIGTVRATRSVKFGGSRNALKDIRKIEHKEQIKNSLLDDKGSNT